MTIPHRTILVCVDQRDESRIALKLACMKARARGGVVELLHVIPPADFQSLGGVAERMTSEQRHETDQMLSILADEVQSLTSRRPALSVVEGDIGEMIVHTASTRADIALLVLGVSHDSHGRGKLISWLAGQLGGKLFVPMLLVPGNLTGEQLEMLV